MTILEEARWYLTHEEIIGETADGKLHIEYDAVDGVKDGIYREWETSKGRLTLELTYRMGELEGQQTVFFRWGSPWRQLNIKEGRKVGYQLQWHKNGQQRIHSHYNEDGKREGLHIEYHKNGKMACLGEFYNGKREGKFTRWDFDGKLTNRVNYARGKKTKESV